MVLAAGLGARMRPLTETLPKPLVPVGGRTLLDRVLDRLEAFGVERVVVNLHHHRATLEAHLARRATPPIVLAPEPELLETGGAVAAALPTLGPEPFFVASADVLWLDGATPTLARLARLWRGEAMDALLLLRSCAAAPGYDGPGDYFLDPAGRAKSRAGALLATHVYAGVAILAPAAFADAPPAPFPLRRILDRAESRGRLWGVSHDGLWFHVGTPESVQETEIALDLRPRPIPAAERLGPARPR
jgi:MurNAc alpha-1-phosphate uridylyltransferase